MNRALQLKAARGFWLERLTDDLREKLHANARETFYTTLPEVGIRVPLTPREWARQFRRIGQGGSPLSMHGSIEFDESVMPWVAEPMDAAIDPDVSHLVLMWASGTGKTDGVVSNVIGWGIKESPRNIMALYPTEAAIGKWSRDVLDRTINSTPALKEVVAERKGREAGNTLSYKAYPGGSIYSTFAGSASNLRGPRVGLAYAGEVDAMPVDVGGSVAKPGEGDPLALLFKRCEGFADAIKIVEGTPTVKHRSRIEAWYNRTDKRKWFVPCRSCGKRFVILFRHIRWPRGKHHLAEVECEHCSAMHTDAQRIRMAKAGVWKPTAPFSGIRGYWLNAFVTTLPPEKGYKTKLHQWAREWDDAKHSENPRERIRTFINTVMAETDNDTETMEPKTAWEPIYARREKYALEKQIKPELPEGVRVITAGWDVQGDRVEGVILGWGRDEQCWALEHIVIHGKPEEPSTWDKVEEALHSRYFHPAGVEFEITVAMIDRGRWTDTVDLFASRPTLAGKIYTVKGASEMGLPVVGRIRKTGRGGTYFRLGTDAAKEVIFGRLALPLQPDRPAPPGYIHFPESFDAEFFQQLTAERAKNIFERGKQFRKYVTVDAEGRETKSKVRNEALDIFVYGLAAFRLRRWGWDELDASVLTAREAKARHAAALPPVGQPVHHEEEDEGNWITDWRR